MIFWRKQCSPHWVPWWVSLRGQIEMCVAVRACACVSMALRGHSYIGNSGAVLRRSFTVAVSAIITCTYISTISLQYVLYTLLRYLDVNGKNKWTVVRQVYGYCGYILLHKKSDSIYNECIYLTQSTQPSSITSVDIPREAPRNFIIGGGRTAGRIDGLLWGIGCSWRMSHLRGLAKCVNATTPFWGGMSKYQVRLELVGGVGGR